MPTGTTTIAEGSHDAAADRTSAGDSRAAAAISSSPNSSYVPKSAFFAAWAGGQYEMTEELTYAVAAVLGLASAAGLAVYGVRFQRKTRQL